MVSRPEFSFRSLILPVYLPGLIFATGMGFTLAIIPLYAKELGAGVFLAGLVVTARGLGAMSFDVPAGILSGRMGERWGMTAGSLATAAAAVTMATAANVWVLAALVLLAGGSFALISVSRLAFVSATVPLEYRGRALALVGGTQRAGIFIGPVLGGFLGEAVSLEATFIAWAILAAVAGLCVAVWMPKFEAAPAGAASAHTIGGFVEVVRENQRTFVAAGSVALFVQLVRNARQLIIPLWGDAIGLSVSEIGLVFGLSSAIDMTLFYPVGIINDRWGRKFTIVPSMVIMGTSLALVPLAESFWPFLFVGLLAGLGNGLGSGAMMTLGADLAPPGARNQFLGAWLFISDAGSAATPALVGAVGQVLSLGAASVLSGGAGFVGAALMIVLVAETLQRSSRVDASHQSPPPDP